MTALINRILVPLADEKDATRTAEQLVQWLDGTEQNGPKVTLLHVIEKGGGTIDKAPLPAAEQQAEKLLGAAQLIVENGGYHVSTRIGYGTDIVETIHETAVEMDASAIFFVPREHNLLTRLVSEAETQTLVRDAPCPVIALPKT